VLLEEIRKREVQMNDERKMEICPFYIYVDERVKDIKININ